MPDLNAGLTATPINAEQRAARAWALIQRRPTSVEIIRAGATLAAQTMRVEVDNASVQNSGIVLAVGEQGVVVYGVNDHATVTDTDLKRKDRFIYNNKEVEIITIVFAPGQIQGMGKVKA